MVCYLTVHAIHLPVYMYMFWMKMSQTVFCVVLCMQTVLLLSLLNMNCNMTF